MASVFDPIRQHADATPENIALRGGPPDAEPDLWTYRRLRDAALHYGAELRAVGVTPGDRVLLVAPSVPEFVVAYMGIQVAGGVAVTVNTMSTRAEAEYVLADARCSLAIVWHELGPGVADAAAGAEIPTWTLSPGARVSGDGGSAEVADRDPEDTAAILYTSGTTGRPKGAQLTVSNLLSAGEIASEVSRGTSADRTGTGLPLFHVFGQASVMMASFVSGGSMSLLARFDPEAMLDMLRRDQLTLMSGVPTMWNAMLHTAARDTDTADFARLRIAVSGGASLPGEIARAFEARFGCTILEGYGLTETTALGTFNDIDRGAKIGFTGRAVPRTQIEVRDADGTVCPADGVGEVFIKGATVMKGYWNRPEDTAAVLSADGWFRTGDLGLLDPDGDLRIVDRLKDLIIRGGYNVYPGEVEEVLYGHPDIVEAAVIGVPHEHYGEEVAAVVTTRAGAELDGPSVTSWARERLSAYKIPRIVAFVDALPKGPSGKILKRSIDRSTLIARKEDA
ncbi:MAG: class I adenylate-forming enzyme family protein [Mycobacteriaceae bacterium]